jgi:hypothetical protein
MNLESILITAILIITLLMFVFVFAIVLFSFIKCLNWWNISLQL